MRDNGFVLVLIVAVVAVVAMVVLSFSSVSDLPVSPDDFVGLAYDGFSDPLSSFTFGNGVVSVSDSAVYRFGYYSVGGGSWQQFTLAGNVLGGNWLTGVSTRSLPDFGPGEHYVVVYSCTRVGGAWDCHGNKWQIKTINNAVTPVPSCTLGTNINCAYCGNVCASDQTCVDNVCATIPSAPVTNTPKGSGTTYYVSNSAGLDTNAGTSESSPWKTLSRVNEQTLNPGDTVLFRRGDTFYGSLTVKSSGVSGRPITFGSYGTASEKPVITGFTTISGWTNEGNGIYSRTVSSQSNPINIVSINGKNTPIGRWPNTGWMIVDSHVGKTSITDSALSASPRDWDGGEIVIRAHWWILDRHPITSHSGTTITYSGDSYYEAMDGNGYFIQNHIGTFDEVGDWAYNGGKLYVYFGSNNPTNYVVKFPSIDDFAYLDNKDYISFDNLHITGYNDAGITIFSAANIRATNCILDFIGDTAFDSPWQTYSDYTVIENNIVDNVNNDGVHFRGDSRYASIQHNSFKNIGSIAGLSGSGDGSGIAIYATADNTVIRYNTIENVGYNGITFGGLNTVVSNNYVSTFCINKDDGAGIYTYEDGDTGKQITNNIVLNGVGAAAGTRLADEHRAQGIYIDGSDNILISGNSIAHNNGAGIFINTQALNMDIRDNVVFDNEEAGIMILSNMRGGGEVRDMKMQNNIFVSEAGQDVLYYATTSDDSGVRQLGTASTINNNYYARPIDDTNTIRTQIGAWSGPTTRRTLAGWQSYSLYDTNSKKSPKVITNAADIRFEYNPTSSSKTVSLGGNYIDIKGAVYSGSVILPPFTSVILIKN